MTTPATAAKSSSVEVQTEVEDELRQAEEDFARGDFSTSYDVQSVVTVTGAPLAELDGRHDLRVEGSYRGACPPGMAPGEASLGRGIMVNPRRLPQLANLFAGA